MLRPTLILAALASFGWCEQEYVVTIEQLETFDGAAETITDFSNVKLIKRERLLNGTMHFREDMDNESFKFGVELLTSQFNGNFMKMGMDIQPLPLCDGFKNFYVQYWQPSFQLNVNTDIPHVPDDGLCPFPAGEYFLKDVFLNTELWPNQMPRGLIKAVISFYKHDNVVGGYAVVLKIENR